MTEETNSAAPAPKRNIGEVIIKIKALVPAEKTDTHQRLGYILRTVPYQAPEYESRWWGELATAVNKLVEFPKALDEPWKVSVVALLMDLTEVELRIKAGKQITC